MNNAFGNIYNGVRVLITGHTGFKGSWLSMWLRDLGAKVVGYALAPSTNPSLYEISRIGEDVTSIVGDIRDLKMLNKVILKHKPDIVFHMAAQAFVRRSYSEPVNTLETNIMGTINTFDACRQMQSVRAILNITSDKCYENREWVWGYRESDPVGGHDPYSASKGCAELVTESYRRSFFPVDEYGKKHETLVASVRAGNVIGGGDWGEDRLVPDVMRAASINDKTRIRNPWAIRPWQHVLEPLSGYLLLGQRLLEGKKEFSGAWNFGPSYDGHKNVSEVVVELQKHWEKVAYTIDVDESKPHEANLLKLDCSKAHSKLDWLPVWNSSETFAQTAQWYKNFYESGKNCCEKNMREYIAEARRKKISWVVS